MVSGDHKTLSLSARADWDHSKMVAEEYGPARDNSLLVPNQRESPCSAEGGELSPGEPCCSTGDISLTALLRRFIPTR